MARPGTVMNRTRAEQVSIHALCPARAALSAVAFTVSRVGGGSCASAAETTSNSTASAQHCPADFTRSLHIPFRLRKDQGSSEPCDGPAPPFAADRETLRRPILVHSVAGLEELAHKLIGATQDVKGLSRKTRP